MGWLILVGLVAACLLIAWAAGRVSAILDRPASRQRGPSGVRGVVPLCSDGEMVFLSVLESVVPDGMRVLCKVRVADVIQVFGADFRTVSQKHFDFVVCDAQTLMPMLAVELDDKSHQTPTAQKSDAVKNAIAAAAGLPLLRVPARSSYNAVEIANALAGELTGHAST